MENAMKEKRLYIAPVMKTLIVTSASLLAGSSRSLQYVGDVNDENEVL
jgi:hypothetical protein